MTLKKTWHKMKMQPCPRTLKSRLRRQLRLMLKNQNKRLRRRKQASLKRLKMTLRSLFRTAIMLSKMTLVKATKSRMLLWKKKVMPQSPKKMMNRLPKMTTKLRSMMRSRLPRVRKNTPRMRRMASQRRVGRLKRMEMRVTPRKPRRMKKSQKKRQLAKTSALPWAKRASRKLPREMTKRILNLVRTNRTAKPRRQTRAAKRMPPLTRSLLMMSECRSSFIRVTFSHFIEQREPHTVTQRPPSSHIVDRRNKPPKLVGYI